MRYKELFVLLLTVTLVLSLTHVTVVAQQKPTIIILANYIDYALASDFFEFLGNKGVNKVRVTATDFVQYPWIPYKNMTFIIILGGPDAYEGVGEIVQEVLASSEQNYLRIKGNRKMYVKPNVWRTGQIVVVIAGSDRFQTQKAHRENRNDLYARDADDDGVKDLLDVEPLQPSRLLST
jgi:putative cell wall-binding protein